MSIAMESGGAPSIVMPADIDMQPSNREVGHVFTAMRKQITEVFPDDDQEAWRWTGEDYEEHDIERPERDFQTWMTERYMNSDEFSKHLVARMFAIWQEMEEQGFEANGLKLFEHQKALFAWIALRTVTGVREEMANVLVRSPYGSGKSLVAGLVVRAMRETQEALLQKGTDSTALPTGILLGLRKEHMLQNAMGKQYAVLQPPYTIERSHVAAYWKNLSAMYGDDFSQHFKKPRGMKDPFYALFELQEDTEYPPIHERLSGYVAAMDEATHKQWEKVDTRKRAKILETLHALMEGSMVLVPDVYNVPQPEKPLPREDGEHTDVRYRGDSAHALTETPSYRVKATHKQLALNRDAYTTQPDTESPSQFLISYGTMVTRAPEKIRADVRREIMDRARLLVVDEAGKYNPQSLTSTMEEMSGTPPVLIGFTGQDRGIEGWTERSPVISMQQMIRLKLMKPIGFAGIGNAEAPPEQGSEEAWRAYRNVMFKDEKTAKTLGLPQPHELDTVIVAPPAQLREYAHRILQAHEEEGRQVKVWCFDGDAGDARWNIIVNGFNAPKQEGEPRRILVAPPSLIAEALHLSAECYDVLTNVNKYAMDQLRGRLGHVRNNAKGKDEQDRARTYFRTQWLRGGSGEAYIRDIAKQMGYELPEDGAQWTALQCMIDREAYERDTKRKNLSKPEPIPDTLAVKRRKKRMAGQQPPATPLAMTSEYVIAKQQRREERETAKTMAEMHARTGHASSLVPSAGHDKNGKPSRETFTVGKGKGAVTVIMDANGKPVNLDILATQFNIASYYGSLAAKVAKEHADGKRGVELAMVVHTELLRLLATALRRQGRPVPVEYSDGEPEGDDEVRDEAAFAAATQRRKK